MGPEIEWQLTNEDGHQTIAKTPAPLPPSRWRKIIVAMMFVLGIGLGFAYRSIPEPLPRPTPTPLPTPTQPPPPRVEETIARESAALARGDLQTFMDLQDPADAIWRQTQLGLFRTWGLPASDPLYVIVETGTLTDDRAWADVIQFRANLYFRETRFYQLKDNQWLRIAPVSDFSFWGEERSTQTAHFNLRFRAKDRFLAGVVAQQFENIYERICGDLQCPERDLPSYQKLQMVLWPGITTPNIELKSGQMIYTLPSPRVAGLYFQAVHGDQPSQDKPLNAFVVESILYYVARTATGAPSTWPKDVTGEQFLEVIVEWERLRLTGQPEQNLLYHPELLASRDLPDLGTIWTTPPAYTQHSAELRWAESTALITFIDEQYGADKVAQFLHTLGQASSMLDVLDGIGLPYQKFKPAWQVWLEQTASNLH